MQVRLISTLVAAVVLAGIVAGSSGSRLLIHTAKGQTRTTVTASPKQLVYGQKVRLTATVTRLSGTGKLGGKVTFYAGLTKEGTGTLILSGSNTWAGTLVIQNNPALGVGSDSITAVYSGNSSFAGSSSRALELKVKKAPTTTVLNGAQLQMESVYGQSVTFTATVAPVVGGRRPTGKVTFYDGATEIGVQSALNGLSSIGSGSLAVGMHTVTAHYVGNDKFAASVSSPVTLTVGKASTTTVAVSKVTESSSGLTLTFTATVTADAPGKGTPTGTVRFESTSGWQALPDLDANANATIAVSSSAVGRGSVTATYSGDANFVGSKSTVVAG